MKFRDYIERNRVFTTVQLASESGLSMPSVQTMLRRAVDAGRIERVRRGVYVSRAGRFADVDVDAFELVAVLDNAAPLSYHSALEAHGVAHNVASSCQFRSRSVRSPFEYAGVTYEPYPYEEAVPTLDLRRSDGLRVLTTTREQTIVDCLECPDRSGGLEEVLMSLSLFPYVDVTVLERLAANATASLAARVGWLLEQKVEAWRVDTAALHIFEKLAKGGPFRLDKDSTESLGWSKRWKLCLPAKEEEVRSWVL